MDRPAARLCLATARNTLSQPQVRPSLERAWRGRPSHHILSLQDWHLRLLLSKCHPDLVDQASRGPASMTPINSRVTETAPVPPPPSASIPGSGTSPCPSPPSHCQSRQAPASTISQSCPRALHVLFPQPSCPSLQTPPWVGRPTPLGSPWPGDLFGYPRRPGQSVDSKGQDGIVWKAGVVGEMDEQKRKRETHTEKNSRDRNGQRCRERAIERQRQKEGKERR